MKGSWKTTVLGVATLIGALAMAAVALLDSNPDTMPDFTSVLAAFTGLGLVFARDNNVSSEDAGLK